MNICVLCYTFRTNTHTQTLCGLRPLQSHTIDGATLVAKHDLRVCLHCLRIVLMSRITISVDNHHAHSHAMTITQCADVRWCGNNSTTPCLQAETDNPTVGEVVAFYISSYFVVWFKIYGLVVNFSRGRNLVRVCVHDIVHYCAAQSPTRHSDAMSAIIRTEINAHTTQQLYCDYKTHCMPRTIIKHLAGRVIAQHVK